MKRYMTPEMEIEFFDGQDLFAMDSLVEGGGSACMGDSITPCGSECGVVFCGEDNCGADTFSLDRCPAEFSM